MGARLPREIQADPAPLDRLVRERGERAAGLDRHRGDLGRVDAVAAQRGQQFEVEMSVAGSRPILPLSSAPGEPKSLSAR